MAFLALADGVRHRPSLVQLRRVRRSHAWPRFPTAQPLVSVALPGAIVDGGAGGLAELAVVDDVDADVALTTGDVDHRSPQTVRARRLVDRPAFRQRLDRLRVQRDQVVRTRRAANVRRLDAGHQYGYQFRVSACCCA